jgi:rubrerythrin
MAKTGDNLQAAFAGESQASRKYLYFAEKADKEGQPQIARLFRAASEAFECYERNRDHRRESKSGYKRRVS